MGSEKNENDKTSFKKILKVQQENGEKKKLEKKCVGAWNRTRLVRSAGQLANHYAIWADVNMRTFIALYLVLDSLFILILNQAINTYFIHE